MSRPKQTILILGASTMQLPAIKIARERNWRVILVDGNKEAEGVALADIFLHIDLKNKEEIVESVSPLRARDELDGVFTAGTDFSATVAWVAEALGLPGIPYEAAMRATDKSLMRAAFRAAGVPSPDFAMVQSPADAREAARELGFPLVVKPVDNMGARGIRRIDTVEELTPAVERALELSRSGKTIVEEYVEGPEYSVDAIVEKGEITVCGVADRKIVFSPYFVEMGHTIPTQSDEATVEAVLSAFRRGVRALGITHGAAKGDIKLSSTGPVIGEIAARLSGGYMSGWTYPYSSGVRPTEAAMRLSLGLPAGRLDAKWHMVSAERAFISIPGVVARVVGFEAGLQLPAIKTGFVRVHAGDRVRFPTNNVEKCGNFIAQADTHAEAVWAAEEACRETVVILQPGDEETASFLFGPEGWIPPAYSLGTDELREGLSTLPQLIDELEGSGGRLSILPLAGVESCSSLDWHGRSLRRSLEIVQHQTGVEVGQDGDLVLGQVFWRALLRGGVQGAIWVVDSVKHGLARRDYLNRLISAWSELAR